MRAHTPLPLPLRASSIHHPQHTLRASSAAIRTHACGARRLRALSSFKCLTKTALLHTLLCTSASTSGLLAPTLHRSSLCLPFPFSETQRYRCNRLHHLTTRGATLFQHRDTGSSNRPTACHQPALYLSCIAARAAPSRRDPSTPGIRSLAVALLPISFQQQAPYPGASLFRWTSCMRGSSLMAP